MRAFWGSSGIDFGWAESQPKRVGGHPEQEIAFSKEKTKKEMRAKIRVDFFGFSGSGCLGAGTP